MKKRSVFAPVLLLALAFLAFLIRRWNEPTPKEAFNREVDLLGYTEQARCHMACRQVTRSDINEIMTKGAINFSRSNRRAAPCPIFALQGKTRAGKRLRVFFVQCPDETWVVSCYRLQEADTCQCNTGTKIQKR